jgi:hypothetical protein
VGYMEDWLGSRDPLKFGKTTAGDQEPVSPGSLAPHTQCMWCLIKECIPSDITGKLFVNYIKFP